MTPGPRAAGGARDERGELSPQRGRAERRGGREGQGRGGRSGGEGRGERGGGEGEGGRGGVKDGAKGGAEWGVGGGAGEGLRQTRVPPLQGGGVPVVAGSSLKSDTF